MEKFSPKDVVIRPFKFDYDPSEKMAYIDYGDDGERISDFSQEEENGRIIDKVGNKIVGIEFLDTTNGLAIQGIPFEKEIRDFCEENGVLIAREL